MIGDPVTALLPQATAAGNCDKTDPAGSLWLAAIDDPRDIAFQKTAQFCVMGSVPTYIEIISEESSALMRLDFAGFLPNPPASKFAIPSGCKCILEDASHE
jgi:hypothetical protein